MAGGSAPQDVDPDAQLLLRARDPQAPNRVARMAQLLVLRLGPQADLAAAVRAAGKHFEEREHRDNPGIAIEPASAEAKEGAEVKEVKIGNAPGAMVRLHVAGDSRKRLVVLAVVRLPTQVLVLQLDGHWQRREWWEREFSQLLDTFHCRAE